MYFQPKQISIIFLALITFSLPSIGSAKMFQNSYVSFQLPDNWGCELEGTEWSYQL